MLSMDGYHHLGTRSAKMEKMKLKGQGQEIIEKRGKNPNSL
jgi:hypothetical protein